MNYLSARMNLERLDSIEKAKLSDSEILRFLIQETEERLSRTQGTRNSPTEARDLSILEELIRERQHHLNLEKKQLSRLRRQYFKKDT